MGHFFQFNYCCLENSISKGQHEREKIWGSDILIHMLVMNVFLAFKCNAARTCRCEHFAILDFAFRFSRRQLNFASRESGYKLQFELKHNQKQFILQISNNKPLLHLKKSSLRRCMSWFHAIRHVPWSFASKRISILILCYVF